MIEVCTAAGDDGRAFLLRQGTGKLRKDFRSYSGDANCDSFSTRDRETR
jgi:hypothetical protein